MKDKWEIGEIIREEDCEAYSFKRYTGFDILHLFSPDFKPSIFNLFRNMNDFAVYVQKPYKYKVGDIVSVPRKDFKNIDFGGNKVAKYQRK